MVEATFTVLGSDFNSDLIERIKMLLNGDIKNFEVKIQITTKESQGAIRHHIDTLTENIELRDILGDDEDIFEENMTEGQVERLAEAIKMSYDQRNLIPHTEAKKMIQQSYVLSNTRR